MVIIISENEKPGVKLEAVEYEKEEYLQKYIRDNPQSIPLPQKQDYIPELMIISREFESGNGPIDVLGVDQEGQLYIVETKLLRNKDKRKIVAQILDYCAGLWKCYLNQYPAFQRILDVTTKREYNVSFNDRFRKTFSGTSEDDLKKVHEEMEDCLNNGKIIFITVMDELFSGLKDNILFLNQKSPFTIIAVQIDCYKHNKLTIMVPTPFGAEVVKSRQGSSRTEKERPVSEQAYFDRWHPGDVTKELYEELKKQITAGCPGVEQETKAQTLGFKRNTTFMDVKAKQKDKLLVYLNLKWGSISDEDLQEWPIVYDVEKTGLRNVGRNNECKDESKQPKPGGIGHHGSGDYEFIITDKKDITKIISLVNIAYGHN